MMIARGRADQPRRGRPHRTLILGGARSGKSVTAERLLDSYPRVDYVATGAPPDDADPDWAARIRAHRKRRPAAWNTLETLDVEKVLVPPGAAADSLDTPVLVDCLSTWLARLMERYGLWDGRPGSDEELALRVDSLLTAWRGTRRHVIAVSNEVGSGVVPHTASGVRFRDELGALNVRVAAECEQVFLCTAGIAQRLK
jgi:adenosylcobinamide kinase / adenosylcobinamide-phosphate guanylyltransferase